MSGAVLTSITIKRFRSIHDATLGLGRVNLFIGRNGSGKSNLLEAIGVLSAVLGRGLDDTSLGERGVRLSRPHMFKSSFKGLKHPRTFRLEAEFQTLDGTLPPKYSVNVSAGDRSRSLYIHSEKMRDGHPRLFGRSSSGARLYRTSVPEAELPPISPKRTRSLWDTHRALLKVRNESAHVIESLTDYGIYAPQTAVMRGSAVEQSPRQPVGLSGAGMGQATLELVRLLNRSTHQDVRRNFWELLRMSEWAKTVGSTHRNASFMPPNMVGGNRVVYFEDRYMKVDRNTLSAYDASEGTLYLLFVALLIHHPGTPPIFALDNVDSTLNPGLVRKLISVIAQDHSASAPKQVFLTSHNPTALDAMDLFDDEQRLFVVSRGVGGRTRFQRIKPPAGSTRDTWAAVTNGRKLSELWVNGQIPEALG